MLINFKVLIQFSLKLKTQNSAPIYVLNFKACGWIVFALSDAGGLPTSNMMKVNHIEEIFYSMNSYFFKQRGGWECYKSGKLYLTKS